MNIKKQYQIFVIIVTYKGHKWYERCFSSLRKSSIPVQTIVIDNASNDGTVEYIRENFPEIHLIESKENLGFGKANNVGMRYALDHGCEYVFLLNQDAWVENDTFENLINIHKRNPEYGILGPVQVNAERNKVLDGVVQFLINPDNCNKQMFSDFILDTKKEVYSVAEINAAAWLLPRNTLEIIGGFDPLFLHYGEDWNYLSRLLYHNLKVGLTPYVRVVHDCVDRVEQKKGYSATFDKWLLQRSCDITYPNDNHKKMMSQYLKKALFKLITLKISSFKKYYYAYNYISKNIKHIEYSRKQNSIKQANWL